MPFSGNNTQELTTAAVPFYSDAVTEPRITHTQMNEKKSTVFFFMDLHVRYWAVESERDRRSKPPYDMSFDL